MNPSEIVVHRFKDHNKASERYAIVTFLYEDGERWDGWVPTIYRRTGVEVDTTDLDSEELGQYLAEVRPHCHPGRFAEWRSDQAAFWDPMRADVTRPFFDKLSSLDWVCSLCEMPVNKNPSRRLQDIKELGYTFATDLKRKCAKCGDKGAAYLMVPVPRGGTSGYETWSPALRRRIVRLLGSYDAYEGKVIQRASLLPDHKFPEIRWDDKTRRQSIEGLTDEEILSDFQLMDNQRNQQKREVCRKCVKDGRRGSPFGIKFYYEGGERWPENVPPTGLAAKTGCEGCGWYDLERWRRSLNERIS